MGLWVLSNKKHNQCGCAIDAFVTLGLVGRILMIWEQVTLGGKDQVDCCLLSAVRLLYAEDGSKIRSMGVEMLQSWDAPTALFGLANECKVLRTLVGLCMLVTAPFPTSISEDQDLLNRDDISENIRLATEFRTKQEATHKHHQQPTTQVAVIDYARACQCTQVMTAIILFTNQSHGLLH
jgi:hypothetical protein